MSIWIADAGPLIFLAKLDRLNLLEDANNEIYISSGVMLEIRGKVDQASSILDNASKTWLQVRDVSSRDTVNLLLADLDIGEAEVITLATELNADKVLLDDLDARRFAHRVGLSAIGTMGILLAARLRGEIASLRNEITQLQHYGFWVSETLIVRVLKEAGEL
ncbi:MAG: DUF3368 domain-containing protein [Chloroflexota bacterium]|nr:DUF3368 domain-containing protein [Chloroflexota bacterium]